MPTVLVRPVTRETTKLVRTPRAMRPLIVTLTRDGLALRAKGTRATLLLPYGTAWVQAAKLAAAAQAAEKAAQRAEKKRQRGR